jgi:nucleoside-diphosphate-sugar epimerase
MERYLVTGGAGFIGSHVVDSLVADGAEVVVVDDLSAGDLGNLFQVRDRVRFVEASILDFDVLREAGEGCRGVFHLAAVTSVPASIADPLPVHRVNALGTLHVLEAARQVGARVVFSSSAAVYGEGGDAALAEDSAGEPISPYGIQKWTGELYLRNYVRLHRLEGLCLRYFNVYGPRQAPGSPYSGVISIFCKNALSGRPHTIFGDGGQTRDYVFVADVVRANRLAMASGNADGRALNVCTGVTTDLRQLATTISEQAGVPLEIGHAPERAGDIRHSSGNPDATFEAIRFKARTSLDEGLGKTVEWMRGQATSCPTS